MPVSVFDTLVHAYLCAGGTGSEVTVQFFMTLHLVTVPWWPENGCGNWQMLPTKAPATQRISCFYLFFFFWSLVKPLPAHYFLCHFSITVSLLSDWLYIIIYFNLLRTFYLFRTWWNEYTFNFDKCCKII